MTSIGRNSHYKNDSRPVINTYIIYAATIILLCILYFYLNFNEFNIEIRLKNNIKKSFDCFRTGPNWAIITSINYPTDAIRTLSRQTEWIILIIADVKTPKDWFRNDSDFLTAHSNVFLLTLEQQMKLDFELINVIPTVSYARKNIGYLYAIKCGAKLIYETDDDNKLIDGLVLQSVEKDNSSILEAIPPRTVKKPLVNPYALYGLPEIWPRGFPLNSISETDTYEFYNVRKPILPVQPWIQQSLADLDPDVDAIYRLTQPKTIGKINFRNYPNGIAIGTGYFSPFNTQNTLYMEQAFWGLLIPYTTTFRVCDIWRGYWAQRLLWDVGGSLIFRPASVKQIRNSHDYFKDFQEELDLYLKAEKLIDFLLSWQSDKTNLFERMLDLGQQMANKGFWSQNEVRAIEAWIRDLKHIGYQPPSIINRQISMKVLNTYFADKTAVCLTGQLDRISIAWPPTQKTLDSVFGNDAHQYDLFYYVSSFNSKKEVDENFLKTHLQPAYGILYRDPPLNPNVSTNNFNLRKGFNPNNLFQQLYGLKRCYEMVLKHSQEFNITYKYFMRMRTDHKLEISNISLIQTMWDAVKKEHKLIIPYDVAELVRYNKSKTKTWSEINNGLMCDKIAIGPIDKMKYYMMRYDNMNMKGIKSLHAETFLYFTLDHYNLTYDRIPWVYNEV